MNSFPPPCPVHKSPNVYDFDENQFQAYILQRTEAFLFKYFNMMFTSYFDNQIHEYHDFKCAIDGRNIAVYTINKSNYSIEKVVEIFEEALKKVLIVNQIEEFISNDAFVRMLKNTTDMINVDRPLNNTIAG